MTIKSNESKFLVIGLLIWFSFITPLLKQSGIFFYELHFVPLVVLFLYCSRWILIRGGVVNKLVFIVLILFGIYITKTFVRADFDDFLEQSAFFVGLVTAVLLGMKRPVQTDNWILFSLLLVGLSIFDAVVSPDHSLNLIPHEGQQWRIYINSIHFTGAAYLLVLLYMMWHVSKQGIVLYKKAKYTLILILLCLGIVMTGSRISILTLGFILFAFLGHKKYTFNFSYIFLLAFFVSAVYFAPVVLDGIQLDGFWGKVTKMDKAHDLSAGRNWLQRYHLNLFINNWLFGVEPKQVDFLVGDSIQGEVAKAGSESMYTKVLAREGVFGIGKIFFYLMLVLYSLRIKCFPAYLISGSIFILNAGNSLTGSAYSFFFIFYMWFYFSAIFHNRDRYKIYHNGVLKKNIYPIDLLKKDWIMQ